MGSRSPVREAWRLSALTIRGELCAQPYSAHQLTDLLDPPVDHPDDPTGSLSIRPDRRGIQPEQPRSIWSRPSRPRAPGDGSDAYGIRGAGGGCGYRLSRSRSLLVSRSSMYGSSSGGWPAAMARLRSSSAFSSAPSRMAVLDSHSHTRKMITLARLP